MQKRVRLPSKTIEGSKCEMEDKERLQKVCSYKAPENGAYHCPKKYPSKENMRNHSFWELYQKHMITHTHAQSGVILLFWTWVEWFALIGPLDGAAQGAKRNSDPMSHRQKVRPSNTFLANVIKMNRSKAFHSFDTIANSSRWKEKKNQAVLLRQTWTRREKCACESPSEVIRRMHVCVQNCGVPLWVD